MEESAARSDDEKVKTMIKLSGALMVVANIAITIAMLAAIAAHARSPDIKKDHAHDDPDESH